jgi:hypothetical protein
MYPLTTPTMKQLQETLSGQMFLLQLSSFRILQIAWCKQGFTSRSDLDLYCIIAKLVLEHCFKNVSKKEIV